MGILQLRFLLLLSCLLTACQAQAEFRNYRVKRDTVEAFDDHHDAQFLRVESTKSSIAHPISSKQIIPDKKCTVKKMLSCSSHCDHAKFYYSDGCCRCACRKNFHLVDSTRCCKASWTQWSEWSSCIRTGWGGIQTRERSCRSDGANAAGSCFGRGSQSRNCSPFTSNFRIRKNVNDLTQEDTHDLIQAMTKFKKDKTVTGYKNIISWHGHPGRCAWNHNLDGHQDNHCSFHHHPLFLPWHRLIIVQLELGLQKYLKNKTLGIPFWDWTASAKDVPYLIRHSQIYDPILKKHVPNPFHQTLIKDGKQKIYSHREPIYHGLLNHNLLRKGTIRAILSHDFANFDIRLERNPHDQIHNCVCSSTKTTYDGSDWCYYGMPTVQYAAWDPAFLLHHSAIDRIFTMRKKLEEGAGVADWTRSRIVTQFEKMKSKSYDRSISMAFDWPLSPFCNKSMNHEFTTLRNKVWTMHKSYYGESLFGFKYTNYNLGNYTWTELQKDFKRNNVARIYRNDDFFVTNSGGLTNKFCKNYILDEYSRCQTSC